MSLRSATPSFLLSSLQRPSYWTHIPPESPTLVGGLSPDDVDQQGAEHVKRAALEAFAADQDLVAVGAGDLPAVGAK
jgi:hypothetical protein